MNKKDYISREDYEEPRCLLNMHPEVVSIPVGRVIEKLDSYLNQNDYSSAERHLEYWLSEAEAGEDDRGKLAVLNEQIGLYRKMGKGEECLISVSKALSLAEKMDIDGTVTYATTLLNAGTGYKAFGKAAEALPLYRKAREIYESELKPDDDRLGGLYNNMALTLTDLEEYFEAREMYNKAIEIMKQQTNGELEVAITWLNLADLAVAERGLEEAADTVEECLNKAEELLNTESLPRNGYYAFVCEKCAPSFGYYGHFMTEKELEQRAVEIYERT